MYRFFSALALSAAPTLASLTTLTSLTFAPMTTLAAPPASPAGAEAEAFASFLGKHPDLTAEALLASLPAAGFLDQLSFDPKKAKHYEDILRVFPLTPAQKALLNRQGMVSFSGGQRYSMASLYQHIYMKDLPVLITADSMLYALHTSFDEVLQRLEEQVFIAVMRDVLMQARDALVAAEPTPTAATRDADLYLTVALNLMRGAGGPAGDAWAGGWDGKIQVVSALKQDDAVLAVLQRIQGLKMETSLAEATPIYQGRRPIDWSQFTPRGHYTKSPGLQAYFRTMMWLGRADTGLNLTTPIPGAEVKPEHERQVAARLALALKGSGGDVRLRQVDELIGFLVGQSDNLGVDQLNQLLGQVGVKKPADLQGKSDTALKEQLVATGLAAQRIRSQWVESMPQDPAKAEPPALFQVFGQRFLIDSFLLSQVVFDSIVFQGVKQQRFMPTALDAWAALGNDEAVRLLEPQLTTWKYAANLAAGRDLVGAYPPSAWQATVYGRWIDALRSLDDLPTDRKNFPQAMQTRAWAHKQLRTQLGSWTELRHDTVLYGKQSYTAELGCEYPAAFVEPYPAFYRKLAAVSAALGQGLKSAKLDAPGRDEIKNLIAGQVRYFATLEGHLERLAAIADRELKGEPLSAADTEWLKKTADIRGGGSGPPQYDGWYTELFYGTAPEDWNPVVADVHTDPNRQAVLHVAVGDAWPTVVVVDNEGDLQAYVGPTYSFYEFEEPNGKRLTDEEWQQRIYDGKLPPIPAWMGSFTAP